MHTRLALASAAGGALLAALIAAPAYAASAPVAHDDNYSTPVNTQLVIAAPGVLGNDTDADGDTLAVKNVVGAQHGNVNVATNGAFTYVPTTNYVGPDQFTYDACEVLTAEILQARQLEAPGCDKATVFITVKGTTPPPTTEPPPVSGARPPVTIVKPPPSTTIVTQPPAAAPNTTIIVPPAPSGSNFSQIGQAPAGAAETGFGPNA